MQSLKTGNWVTKDRIEVYSWMLVTLWLVGIGVVILTSQGGLDFKGRPLGTDFSNVWSAGRLANDGTPASAYDTTIHHGVQKDTFNAPNIPYYGWHYPPVFLMVASVLAVFPYAWALAAWMLFTLPLYITVVRKISSFPLTGLVALAFPAVAINLIHGQNGFINAALMGAGLLMLDRRPVWAGVMFGLLSYKPQFGVLIPIVLMVTGRWSTFAAAAVTVVTLVGLSIVLFGADVWQAFYTSTGFTRHVVLEAGALSWDKLVSTFAALRLLGTGVAQAYAGQGVVALGALVSVVWLWKKPVSQGLKSSGLVVAALLVTPYVLDYDLVMLGLGIAWMTVHGMKNGFLPGERSALVMVWVMPMVSRLVAQATAVPLGLIVLIGFLGLILRRARHDMPSSDRTNCAVISDS